LAPNDINGGSDYPIDVIFFTFAPPLRTFGAGCPVGPTAHVPAVLQPPLSSLVVLETRLHQLVAMRW
jgi:hypothetical protein